MPREGPFSEFGFLPFFPFLEEEDDDFNFDDDEDDGDVDTDIVTDDSEE